MSDNSLKREKDRIEKIIEILDNLYPSNKSELEYDSPFQLLVSTILSAQATDKKVNEITKNIYDKYKTAYDFSQLQIDELEGLVRQINYYKTKAKHIIEMSKDIVDKYKGEVPSDREALMKLAGVGRKTANCVLSYAYNIPAIAVDTHVFRVANRLGLANSNNVLLTELQLEKNVPKELWLKAHTSLVLHGRRICDSRKPQCINCLLSKHCKYFNKL